MRTEVGDGWIRYFSFILYFCVVWMLTINILYFKNFSWKIFISAFLQNTTQIKTKPIYMIIHKYWHFATGRNNSVHYLIFCSFQIHHQVVLPSVCLSQKSGRHWKGEWVRGLPEVTQRCQWQSQTGIPGFWLQVPMLLYWESIYPCGNCSVWQLSTL